MPPAPVLRRFALGLLVATIGGLAFQFMGWPLAWMLGPMLATTLAAIAKLEPAIPNVLRTPMLAVLGVLLGSSFTPDLVGDLIGWLPTLLSLPIYVVLISAVGTLYLRKVAGFDQYTALFAGTPGGFGEMVLLGERAGANVQRLALVHAVRVLLIVLTVPLVMRALGHDVPSTPSTTPAGGWFDIVALLATAILGMGLGRLLRLPASGLMGGMLLSAIGHAMGWIEGAPPIIMVAAAQLIIGGSVGCRFTGFRLHDVLATLVAGLGLTLIMTSLSSLGALALHWLTGADPVLLILALMPGGLAEMAMLAFALDVDPAFIAAHHLVRIMLIVAAAPFVFRWLDERHKRQQRGPPPPGG